MTKYARVAETLSRVRVRLDGPSGPNPDNPELEPDEDILTLLAARLAELQREQPGLGGALIAGFAGFDRDRFFPPENTPDRPPSARPAGRGVTGRGGRRRRFSLS